MIQKIFRSRDVDHTASAKKQAITIVSGLPRSGTSLMMKMLEAGGISPLTDNLRTADTDNPKGYYEFERVKALPEGDVDWVGDAHGKVVKVISALLKHLPDKYSYRIVFMRRHIDEILASQRKMLTHRNEDSDTMNEAQLTKLFEDHLLDINRWLKSQANVDVVHIHYSDILSEPAGPIVRLNEFLGGELDTSAMGQIVDPSLYRNRSIA